MKLDGSHFSDISNYLKIIMNLDECLFMKCDCSLLQLPHSVFSFHLRNVKAKMFPFIWLSLCLFCLKKELMKQISGKTTS